MENAFLHLIIITIMYIYHVLINALSAHIVVAAAAAAVVVFCLFFVLLFFVRQSLSQCNRGFITVIA